MKSILLIDDNRESLAELEARLGGQLPLDVEVRTWIPGRDEEDAQGAFNRRIDADTTFVVTDYDLTRQGPRGFFGTSIVGWCQAKAIPVGDFSIGNPGALPKEPDLFEIRVPTESAEAARFIAAVSHGFSSLREALNANNALLTRGSPASVLATMLGEPSAESQFALYGVRLGTASGALTDQVMATAPRDREPSDDNKRRLLTYIVGHLLLNAVLRFPGPIVSMRALKAYIASDEADAPDVRAVFAGATYAGPFSRQDDFFWLSKVDEVLDGLMSQLPEGTAAETNGEMNRRALELRLGRQLRRHECPRCQGANGGFFCPLTARTVCLRQDCSVGSNSWIPAGARLCRIERDFFDEWAPILGL